MRFLCVVSVVFCFLSCNKIKYYPDKATENIETKIIAHRAGGNDCSQYKENTYRAAKYSLSRFDGIEVDIQISKDRTIWLAHDVNLGSYDGVIYNCFPETNDVTIEDLNSIDSLQFHFSRLETVFNYIHENCPDKYISLDLKAWIPCDFQSSDVIGVMNVIADEVIRLTEKYNLKNRVMVESETATVLDYIKKRSSDIECYLVSWGDFERAFMLILENGYDGLSFKYKFDELITAESVNLLHNKGLKIQLWTVNSPADIEEALELNPDFIQTDNLTYFFE